MPSGGIKPIEHCLPCSRIRRGLDGCPTASADPFALRRAALGGRLPSSHRKEGLGRMQCPACSKSLLITIEYEEVELDFCEQCRGVWLDRGELDKLIERSGAMTPVPAASASAQSQPQFADSDYEHGRGHQGNHKKSWLSNIFD